MTGVKTQPIPAIGYPTAASTVRGGTAWKGWRAQCPDFPGSSAGKIEQIDSLCGSTAPSRAWRSGCATYFRSSLLCCCWAPVIVRSLLGAAASPRQRMPSSRTLQRPIRQSEQMPIGSCSQALRPVYWSCRHKLATRSCLSLALREETGCKSTCPVLRRSEARSGCHLAVAAKWKRLSQISAAIADLAVSARRERFRPTSRR